MWRDASRAAELADRVSQEALAAAEVAEADAKRRYAALDELDAEFS